MPAYPYLGQVLDVGSYSTLKTLLGCHPSVFYRVVRESSVSKWYNVAMRHHVALRRQEVAQLAADGVSCRAIAAELGVSASTVSRDLRALAAVSEPSGPGTPGGAVAPPSAAPGAVGYDSVAEQLAELDRLLGEWRERASHQTTAAALFARLLAARHNLAGNECQNHFTVADVEAKISAVNLIWVSTLQQVGRDFAMGSVPQGETARPILQRALDHARIALRALGGDDNDAQPAGSGRGI